MINKPLIHINPIPGVEDYNASFFAQNKMSIRVNNIKDLAKTVEEVLNNRNLQKEMIENQKKYINKTSAADLVKYIQENFGSDNNE